MPSPREMYAQEVAALVELLGERGVHLVARSAAHPLILQGTLMDGAPCDIRGSGNCVRLRAWEPGAVWQRTVVDGLGVSREVPDVHSVCFTKDYTNPEWRWGAAARLSIDELELVLGELCDAYDARAA